MRATSLPRTSAAPLATCDHSSCAVFQRDSGVAIERWAAKSPKQKSERTKPSCILDRSPGLNLSVMTLIYSSSYKQQSICLRATMNLSSQRNSVVGSCLGPRPLALYHQSKVKGCEVCSK